MLHFYVRHDTILKLIKNYQLQRLDKVLSKYSKYRRSVGEIRDQYEELSQYSKHSRLVREVEYQFEGQSKYLKLQSEDYCGKSKIIASKKKKQE